MRVRGGTSIAFKTVRLFFGRSDRQYDFRDTNAPVFSRRFASPSRETPEVAQLVEAPPQIRRQCRRPGGYPSIAARSFVDEQTAGLSVTCSTWDARGILEQPPYRSQDGIRMPNGGFSRSFTALATRRWSRLPPGDNAINRGQGSASLRLPAQTSYGLLSQPPSSGSLTWRFGFSAHRKPASRALPAESRS